MNVKSFIIGTSEKEKHRTQDRENLTVHEVDKNIPRKKNVFKNN